MTNGAGEQSPNLLFITSHDLGQHLGCYGVPTVTSPNLDALAADGVRLANSFCSAPQCSPSRSSMFTGRYPHSNGVMGLTHAHFGWDLHDDERHLAAILRDAGYATAWGGNTHETRRPGYFGFDQGLRPGGGHHAGGLAEAACEFVAEQADAARPFYLQLGFFEPHRARTGFGHAPDEAKGVTVPPYLVDEQSSREELAYFEGAVRALDRAVGYVLDTLEATGQAADTLVVFCADHGVPFPRAKCSLYDAGLEVATLLRWPAGGLTGGAVHEALVSNVDYLPTLADLIGFEAPPTVQGRSFAPLLLGGDYQPNTMVFGEMTYHDYTDPVRCVRTERWKLIANFTSAPSFMDPSQTWRRGTVTVDPPNPPYAYHPPIELYDLASDPLERHNLVDEPACAAVKRDLLDALHGWMVGTGDPLLGGIPASPMHHATMRQLRGEGA